MCIRDRFRAADRTLTEDEANAAKLAAVEYAGSAVGARLRLSLIHISEPTRPY